MSNVPKITVPGSQKKSWRVRRGPRASFPVVRDHVCRNALSRVRSPRLFALIPLAVLPQFERAVEFVLFAVIESAIAVLRSGGDLFSKDGYRQASTLTVQRLANQRGVDWAELLRTTAPIRQAIIGAAFVWLRVQFPVLNAASAVVAVQVLQEFLQSRAAAE